MKRSSIPLKVFIGFLLFVVFWVFAGGWFDPVQRISNLRVALMEMGGCVLGLVFWLFFFAQFTLPLHHLKDRWHSIVRLGAHLLGLHGPALFVRDGMVVSHPGEEEKTGLGLVWLDSASGAVLRNAVRFTRTVGPGIYFTGRYEKIAGTVDLHIQNQTIGPRGNEDPFVSAPVDDSEEARLAFENAQIHAQETLARTRDDLVVVPNIIVIFKIKAEPAKGNESGSRFGYNADSVFRAVTSNGVDPTQMDQESKHVMWNEMPAYIAADVWRELLGKYTMEELFHPLPFDPSEIGEPPEAMTQAMRTAPSPPPEPRNALQAFWWEVSGWLAQQVERFARLISRSSEEPPPEAPEMPMPQKVSDDQRNTVLAFIQGMVKKRLSEPLAPVLNNIGRPTGEWFKSPEYEEMERRGIQVRAVVIANLRFLPTVEQKLVTQWTTNWLADAKRQRDLLDKKLDELQREAEHRAVRDMIEKISEAIVAEEKDKPCSNYVQRKPCYQKLLLRAAMKRTRGFIRRYTVLRQYLASHLLRLEDMLSDIDRRINEENCS